jgi:hypothetical protein
MLLPVLLLMLDLMLRLFTMETNEEYFPDIDDLYEQRTEVIDAWYDAIEDVIDTYYEDDTDEDSCCV